MTAGLSKWDFSLAKQETPPRSVWSRDPGLVAKCVYF